MAKYRAARGRRKPPASRFSAIPCLVIIVLGFVLLYLLFYFSLKGTRPTT